MKEKRNSIRAVGILEDNEPLRSNIEYYLNKTDDYFTCFSEPCIQSLLAKDIDCIPDCILLDIHLQNTNSIDLIGEMTIKFPGSNIIIMTGDKNEQFILKAFQNGAKGYINKPFSMQDLINTISSLHQNGSYMAPDTATKLINLITKTDNTLSLKQKFDLTEREYDIITLMRDGLGYQEIADKLYISYHTVNHHTKRLYAKMHVKSRTELMATYMLNN